MKNRSTIEAIRRVVDIAVSAIERTILIWEETENCSVVFC